MSSIPPNANNLDALFTLTGSPAWTTDLINDDHFLGASSTPAARARSTACQPLPHAALSGFVESVRWVPFGF